MVIVPNTANPIVDTNRTMVLVRLAWLLGKQFSINPLPDQLKFTESPQMLTETPLPDPLAIEPTVDGISMTTLPDPLTSEPTEADISMGVLA